MALMKRGSAYAYDIQFTSSEGGLFDAIIWAGDEYTARAAFNLLVSKEFKDYKIRRMFINRAGKTLLAEIELDILIRVSEDTGAYISITHVPCTSREHAILQLTDIIDTGYVTGDRRMH